MTKAAIVLVAALAAAYSAPEATAQPAQTGKPAPAVAAVKRLSAADLYHAYHDNEVRADRRFRGRQVEIDGTVTEIGKDAVDTPFVAFGRAGLGVRAYFPTTAEARLAALRKGQHVTLRGTVDGMLLGVVSLADSELR